MRLILFFVAMTTSVARGIGEDELASKVKARCVQESNRTFKTFDPEQAWQRLFFFMKLADTQYDMFLGSMGFERRSTLVQQTVEHTATRSTPLAGVFYMSPVIE